MIKKKIGIFFFYFVKICEGGEKKNENLKKHNLI